MDDATLADLYRAAAVTAYPSLYEGFGLPVVEAMSCGCPVVASGAGGDPRGGGRRGGPGGAQRRTGSLAGLRAALDPTVAERLRVAGPDAGRALHARRGWATPRGRPCAEAVA